MIRARLRVQLLLLTVGALLFTVAPALAQPDTVTVGDHGRFRSLAVTGDVRAANTVTITRESVGAAGRESAFVVRNNVTESADNVQGGIFVVDVHAPTAGASVAMNAVLRNFVASDKTGNIAGHIKAEDRAGTTGEETMHLVGLETGIIAVGDDCPEERGCRIGVKVVPIVSRPSAPDGVNHAEGGTALVINDHVFVLDGRTYWAGWRNGALISDERVRSRGGAMQTGVTIDTAGVVGLRIRGEQHTAIRIEGTPRVGINLANTPIVLGRNTAGEAVTMQLVGDRIVVTGATIDGGAP